VTIGGSAKFGAEPVSFGIAHATGEGSQLSIGGKLTLGDGGTGELALADGATAQVRAMLIADKQAAIGELLLQDYGTRFDVAEQLEVGGAGHAVVRVESAAVLTAAELTLATEASATASSELVIEGVGSRVETGATVIGQHGIARLEIRNGARLASGQLAVLDAADPDLVIEPGVAASATIGHWLLRQRTRVDQRQRYGLGNRWRTHRW
jgi:autotransporter family porin